MNNKSTSKEIKVLDGNRAAAYGAMLCQPDVIAAYPITPQTDVVETLYNFKAQGLLDAELIEPESEHSSMGILRGAAVAGGRTFTATAAQGLVFMFENCIQVATQRLPIVMVNVCREIAGPHIVVSGHSDIMMTKGMGWIQLHARSCQEILDLIVMAYKLAEDKEIRTPVVVCYDGWFLSHMWEPVEIPTREEVAKFLPPLETSPKVDPQNPMVFGPWISSRVATEYRYKQSAAISRAKEKFDEIAREFQENFGRGYGGQIEEYMTDDADIVLIAMGSSASTARVIIDKKRAEGLKVGLLRVRMFRPFPKEKLATALKQRKAIGVLDRSVYFGWDCGNVFPEVKAALYDLGIKIPMLDFICGLCDSDITPGIIERAIDFVDQAAQGKSYNEVTWLDLE
ncbi:MAG: hypothetical protein PHU49_02120 [Syntrophorhabdaceae bacterium]|nr:hypothetical protein [Syntrophorhabdaceae bacterium]MDD5242789.1 hypothetical protein [Syntrophorhabdaceae bacterium]